MTTLTTEATTDAPGAGTMKRSSAATGAAATKASAGRRAPRGRAPGYVVAGGLGARFVAAARQLGEEGAGVITTSCGFLVLLQRPLQEAVGIPVVTSSLLQLPQLLGEERQVGVLTIDAERLGSGHLQAAGEGVHALSARGAAA